MKQILRKLALVALLCAPWVAWAQQTLPYSYGFENNDLAAEGWTLNNMHTSTGIVTSAAQNGTYGFQFYYNTNPPQYLISPEFSCPSGVTVEFAYKNRSTTYQETFYVGYSSTTTDDAAFTWGTLITASSASWENYENTFPAGTKYIAIKYVANNMYSLYIDDISLATPSSCPKPTGLEATLTSGNGSVATLAWLEAGTATNWVIEYGTASDFTGAASVAATTNPYNLTGLTAEQTYYARVKADCGGGDQSAWSTTCTFTPTDAHTLTVNDGTTTNQYVPIYGTYVDQGIESQFIIPAADLAAMLYGHINKLTFYASQASVTWGAAQFEVYMAEVSGTTLSAAADWSSMALVKSAGTLSISGNQMEVTLDYPHQYMGDNLMIGFKQTVTGSFQSTSWYGVAAAGASMAGYAGVSQHDFLPKTTFAYTPGVAPSCPKPTGLAATLTPGNGSVATLAWTEAGTATNWVIEYGTASDFTGAASVAATTNPYNLTGLTAEQTYYARVKADCGGGDQSAWSTTCTFTPTDAHTLTVNDGTTTNQYVPIYGTYVDQGIESQFIIPAADLAAMLYGHINKLTFYASQASVTWGAAQFEVYMAEVSGTTLSAAADWSSMALVKSAGTLSISGNQMEVTLDYPHQYMGDNLMIGFKQTVTGSFQSTSWYGVAAAGASMAGAPSSYAGVLQRNFLPKTTFAYTPGVAPSCAKPTGLAVSYTGGNTAQVSWTSDATAWNLDVNGTVTAITTNPYTLTGLALGTAYEVKLQADCGSAGTSAWTDPASFVTDLCMPADQCQLTFELTDSYGDGWNGNAIKVVDVLTNTVLGTLANENLNGTQGTAELNTLTLPVCDGRDIEFQWVMGSFSSEASWVIKDINGEEITSGTGNPSMATGDVLATYTVSCVVSSCRKPTGLALASTAGPTSAELEWTENGGSTAWKVAYKTASDADFTEVNAPTNPFTLTGLTPETDYTVKVRPVCDDATIKWSDEIAVTTSVSCPVPAALAADGITDVAATLSWTGYSDNYDVRYRSAQIQNFENGMGSWTAIDADGDGYNWELGLNAGDVYDGGSSLAGEGRNGGDMIVSGSYSNTTNAALTPDNWLVSPQVVLGGEVSFYAKVVLSYYPEEHLGVFVSTAGNTDPAAFTLVQEWTLDASHANWTLFTVDLSAYSGNGYVAIRHFNCTDRFFFYIDDIAISEPESANPWINLPTTTATSANLTGLTAETDYEWQVMGTCGSATTAWASSTFTTLLAPEEVSIAAGKWHAIASPMHDPMETHQSIANVDNLTSGTYDMFRYDEASSTWENQKAVGGATGFTTMDLCHGYIYRCRDAATLVFRGQHNIGNIVTPNLTKSATVISLAGFHLVGNPYPHPLAFSSISTYSGTLAPGYYSLQGDGSWIAQTGGTLAKGEAVLVQIISSYAALEFTDAPSTKAAAPAALALTVSNGEHSDVAYAMLHDGTGLAKMNHLEEGLPTLSIPVAGSSYAIALLGQEAEQFDLAFGGAEGTYTLTADNQLSLPYLHLIDRTTGRDIDLLRERAYTFSHSGATQGEARFQVKLSPDADLADGTFAVWTGSEVVVSGEGLLQVFDAVGRQLFSQEVDAQTTLSKAQFPATGVYVLKLNEKAQKIVVK